MSHLQRVYTDYFYVDSGKGKKKQLQKKFYMNRDEFMKFYPMTPLPGPEGMFPCKHEERGFLSKKGRKSNHTRTRMKRRNKARIRARKTR